MSVRTATLALLAGVTLAAPVAASATPVTEIAVVGAKAPTAPAPAAHTETAGYADREARNQQVASYQGGSTVVVAMSGGALVVLLVLLLLL